MKNNENDEQSQSKRENGRNEPEWNFYWKEELEKRDTIGSSPIHAWSESECMHVPFMEKSLGI